MEISIKVEQYEKKDLENFIKTCEENGFKVTREGGGNMPNYSGYFAQLKGERWQKSDTGEKQCNLPVVIASKPDIKAAINHAISAIYFNDSSDYLTALYEVVCSLTDLEDPDDEEVKKLFKELNP